MLNSDGNSDSKTATMLIERFLRYWHGVGLTVLFLGAIHLASTLLMTMWPLAFIPLAYTAYRHGLKPALISASLVSSYAFYALSLDRAIPVVVAAVFVVVPMGILKRRAILAESINGNMAKVREIRILTRFLLDHRHQMNDGLLFRFLEEIEDRAGNLEALVWGWRQIRIEAEKAEEILKQGLLRRAALEMKGNGADDDGTPTG